jgi:dihydroneopterin aldolase
MDVIAIEGLTVDCVVGVYPEERDVPQPLTVDLEMELDTRAAGDAQRLALSVDYAETASQLAFVLRAGRFFLLETAAEALTRLLLAPAEGRAPVSRVKLRLRKPLALAGKGVPSLTVVRDERPRLHRADTPWGHVETIARPREVVIERVHIDPGGAVDRFAYAGEVGEWVLGEGLLLQHEPVEAGTEVRWPVGAVRHIANPTAQRQSLLRVAIPGDVESHPEDGALAPLRRSPPFLPRPPR